jgi:two-component system chemotaxis sensor kinase CheA
VSDEILAAFAAESAEIFEAIEDAVRDFDAGDAGAVDRLFRHVHTLKGSAGIVGLGRLEAFAHAWESRISEIRAGKSRPGPDCAGALLALRDRAMSILEQGEPAVGAEGPARAGATEALTPEDEEALAALDAAMAAEGAVPTPTGARQEERAAPGPAPAQGQAPGLEAASRRPGAAASMARVPSAKLENILSLSSEIVVAVSNLGQAARATGAQELVAEIGVVEGLAASLYRSVLDTRMVPFGDVAGRFRRAVEDIARDRGKRIRFELSGAETEIDKSLADRLAEPILHLVRNAADHGVERPEERKAAGKPAEGLVALRARREAGLLSIRVEDDGRGIDPEAVRRRAAESGLLAPEARPTVDELMEFLFLPGFSLSSEVTKWSGRGVGLDAVKRAVSALRGTARIESDPGLGSTAIIRLPLALSLVEGFVARVGQLSLLVPFDVASSCIEIEDPGSGGQSFRLVEARGSLLPSVDLAELYGEGRRSGRRVVIILDDGRERTGLLADEVAESVAAAVRPLDRNLADSPGIAGHATLGDGSMVLVLDAAELGRLAIRGVRKP